MRNLAILVFFALVAATALTGTQFRPGEWYQTLAKPSWTPPNWVFGPVWGSLYIMIALAGWLVWRTGDATLPLAFWAVGLVLNAAWSWLFFGQKMIGAALVDVVAMWCTILAFIVTAWGHSVPASLLFVPYLAWVSLATALNFTIWRLNG